MKTAMYCIILLLSIYPLSGYGNMLTYDKQPLGIVWDRMYRLGNEEREYPITEKSVKEELSPMEALDVIQINYASNFEQVKIREDEYYYKLDLADYYLVYEGEGESEQQYLFHLYEFVLDEPEEGIGHTVTYGWFQMDKVTGEITELQ